MSEESIVDGTNRFYQDGFRAGAKSMEAQLSEAETLLEEIENLISLAGGWEDGETFYQSTIEQIREKLKQRKE